MKPKVFICHASEDKQRFVERFAARLRENGVDAWLDQWEMLPGDSLVDKLFEEGLKNCRAMIVVLSKYSVVSKWVREELNAGMVKRISEGTKLIPIRLDLCDVPECLKSTLWQDIDDPSDYDPEFARLLASIHGQVERPPLGEPPAYAIQASPEYENLSIIDTTIFTAACKHAVETASLFIQRDWLESETVRLGLRPEQVVDSQEVMENRSYVVVSRVLGPRQIYDMSITEAGFNQFARTQPEYGAAIREVALMIVRDGCQRSTEMAEKSGLGLRFIEHALFVLDTRSYIRTTTMADLDIFVDWWSPELRRSLE